MKALYVYVVCMLMWSGVVAGPVDVWAKAERASGVPKHKIYAIALQESGMTHRDNLYRPWPWTINSSDGAKRFASKKEAYDEIKRLAKSGITNIDVGLMQINLWWNWDLVVQRDVLDPETNVMIAAEILRSRMKSSNGDVEKAVAAYHSKKAEHGIPYGRSVRAIEDHIKVSNVQFK